MRLIYTNLRTSLLLLLMVLAGFAQAQTNYGQLRGTVKDALTGKILDYATVRLEQNGIFVDGSYSDMDGNFTFAALNPGNYDVIVTYIGYDTAVVSVTITSDSYIFRDIKMSKVGGASDGGKVLGAASVSGLKGKKLIETDDQKKTFTDKDIKVLPTRSVASIAGLTAGVNVTRSGVSFRGSRTDGTAYFIDGVRAIGAFGQMQAAQSQITIYQNGIPAQFGDFTGGAISITTKGASRFHQGSFEITSSTPTEFVKFTKGKFDNDNRFKRANRFDWNQMEGFAQGPLYIKNKGQGAKERVVLGYMVAGNLTYTRDPSPSYIGVYKVNDAKLSEIEQHPLVTNVDGGLVHAGNFLTMNDMENVRVRPNSHSAEGNFQGKIDYSPNRNMDLSFFTSLQYAGGPAVSNNIMNYKLNAISNNITVRSYLRFTHRIPSDTARANAGKVTFNNTYYTIRVDYQNTFSRAYDPVHGDRIFDYGYIGKFERYQTPNYTYRPDPSGTSPKMYVNQNGDTVYISNYYEQIGFMDTAYKFIRADQFIPGDRGKNMNPLRANYTTNLYNYYDERGGNISNELQVIQGQGLINGYNPPNVYSIWSTPGFITANWSKGQAERYTAFAMFETQIKNNKKSESGNIKPPHDLQFGFMYEKTVNRGYGLGAAGLWMLMPQLMNTHLKELDKEHPFLTYDQNGVFTDTVKYQRFINTEQQTNFDKNFRNKVIKEGIRDVNGNFYNERSFIEINSFTPDDFDLSLFSANDLLNNGSSYVSYYGYDHLGNIVRGKPSVEAFTNDPAKRLIGAFQPVYSAAWIQDKFAYKDIIFRLGLRMERYDANELVLKDPYSLFPVKTVGEVGKLNGIDVNHPSNMGQDYKVYVNDVKNPTRILGYRDGDQWYDASGNEVNNPEIIANQTNSGRIAPYLVDPANQKLTGNSFRDFIPKINVLPRILFSFPIKEDANFYASFDVLAQKPISTYSFSTIDNYYFMDTRNTGAMANPNLKPRIKTEYQIGFKQMIGDNSSIELGSYYAEIKNDIQLYQYNQAYPVNYISYQNIDFSTVKGFTTEYQLDGEHLSFRANYNLQFADGTGSNPNAASALIASGQPNLRTLFPLGDLDIRHQIRVIFNYNFGRNQGKYTYQGPTWGNWGEKVFRDVNANFVITANSGLPYTQTNVPTQIGSADRANIKGTPFGARLPWQFNADLNIQKNFLINRGKTREGKERKPITATAFLWITNVFNFERISGVYPYTGSPVDDGFLNSPRGQQAVSEQLSAQSYYDLYRILTTNPGNFLAPRFSRLGVRFNF